MPFFIAILAVASFLLFFIFYAIHVYAPSKKKLKYLLTIVLLIIGSIGALTGFLKTGNLTMSIIGILLVALAASSFLIALSMDMFIK